MELALIVFPRRHPPNMNTENTGLLSLASRHSASSTRAATTIGTEAIALRQNHESRPVGPNARPT